LKFTGKLPQGFVLSKPIKKENYKEAVLTELEKQGKLVITRKRDGWKLFAATDATGKVRLYTDGMNEVDGRLAHVKDEVGKLRLPKNSLIVGEVLFDLDDNDELGGVQSVMGASLENALTFQKKNGLLRYMLFGVLYLEGERLNEPYRANLERIVALLSSKKLNHIFKVPTLDLSLDEAKKVVLAKGWEGLVLYDADFVPEIRLDGKDPKRPKGCYKWKPILEEDFIVRERIMRPDGTVKELVLLQIDPKTDKEFCCGKLGSFTNAMRKELAAATLPLVVQAEFEARYRKTGKIRNSKFVRVRHDKKARHCVSPKSFGVSS
jgi:ATP-dependent DNA ligase